MCSDWRSLVASVAFSRCLASNNCIHSETENADSICALMRAVSISDRSRIAASVALRKALFEMELLLRDDHVIQKIRRLLADVSSNSWAPPVASLRFIMD
jgi:hypothetical protein